MQVDAWIKSLPQMNGLYATVLIDSPLIKLMQHLHSRIQGMVMHLDMWRASIIVQLHWAVHSVWCEAVNSCSCKLKLRRWSSHHANLCQPSCPSIQIFARLQNCKTSFMLSLHQAHSSYSRRHGYCRSVQSGCVDHNRSPGSSGPLESL